MKEHSFNSFIIKLRNIIFLIEARKLKRPIILSESVKRRNGQWTKNKQRCVIC